MVDTQHIRCNMLILNALHKLGKMDNCLIISTLCVTA